MIDIISMHDGLDLGTYDTQTTKATNILSVQIGSLEYASTLGIDLSFFLSDEFSFQNESFKSYLIEVLANRGVNIASLTDNIETLFRQYIFNLQPAETSTGLIAR